MSICPVCKTKLVPIIYGIANPKAIELHNKGVIFLGGNINRNKTNPNSYCPLCEETYNGVTDIPSEFYN